MEDYDGLSSENDSDKAPAAGGGDDRNK
jgi:hypothetical protein